MKVAYIHGFNSSSRAKKASVLQDVISRNYPDVDFEAPDFPDNLSLAIETLRAKLKEWTDSYETVGLVGSSMGGFISVLLSLEFKVKLALINPCLYPHRFCLENNLVNVPLQNPDTKNNFVITKSDVQIMEKLSETLGGYSRGDTKVYLQTGDTVLDYTVARDFFCDVPVHIEEGGCHGYDNFGRVVPDIIEFFKK